MIQLKSKLSSILQTEIDPSKCNPAGEVISILEKTDWIRIYLIQDVQHPSFSTLEVEISIPNCGGIYSQESLIENMISHLSLMRELSSIGFEVEVVKEDCIWVARKELSKVPDDEVFKALSHGNLLNRR